VTPKDRAELLAKLKRKGGQMARNVPIVPTPPPGPNRWPMLTLEHALDVAPGGLKAADAAACISYVLFKNRAIFAELQGKLLASGEVRRAVRLGNSLVAAGVVIRRRSHHTLDEEIDHEQPFNLPLPGLAGMTPHTWESLAFSLSMCFNELEKHLSAEIAPHLRSKDDQAELWEAAMIAEQVCDFCGMWTPLSNEKGPFWLGAGVARSPVSHHADRELAVALGLASGG